MEEGQSGNVKTRLQPRKIRILENRGSWVLGAVDAVDLRLEIYGNLQQGKSYFSIATKKGKTYQRVWFYSWHA